MKTRKNIPLVLGLSFILFVMVNSVCAGSKYEFGELTDLADKYKTDKGSRGHHYTEVYEYFFYPLKDKARKICEIGVASGASLKMFRRYFPKAVVYGIDIEDTSHLNCKTVKTFIADQANRKQLKDFINTYEGNFDIILDDGGHSMEQQQVSFGYLFKYLKARGYYIIEDVHTSLTSFYGASYGAAKDEENTTLTMINNFIRDGKIKSEYMTEEEINYLNNNIEYCNLLSKKAGSSITCIFKKKEI